MKLQAMELEHQIRASMFLISKLGHYLGHFRQITKLGEAVSLITWHPTHVMLQLYTGN